MRGREKNLQEKSLEKVILEQFWQETQPPRSRLDQDDEHQKFDKRSARMLHAIFDSLSANPQEDK